MSQNSRNDNRKKVLLAGGAGYIGSHVAVTLINSGYKVFIADNFSNCKVGSMGNIFRACQEEIDYLYVDLTKEINLDTCFTKLGPFEAVIHLAGHKAVNESVLEPLKYYENNLMATLTLLKVMKKRDCKKLIFSSSAAVYGPPKNLPIDESHPANPINPYGRTKLMSEEMMEDFVNAEKDMKVVALRYFNPVGAHESGYIGEDPRQKPSNLVPYVCKVATGELPVVKIFGDAWNTKDGTGERDYIHVMDLAEGHLAALKYMQNHDGEKLWRIFNLGTGKAHSVKEVVDMLRKVSGKPIKTECVGNRAGDVAVCYADVTKAERELGWKAEHGLERMCRDSWLWEKSLNY